MFGQVITAVQLLIDMLEAIRVGKGHDQFGKLRCAYNREKVFGCLGRVADRCTQLDARYQ